jgi:hypothetical protein
MIRVSVLVVLIRVFGLIIIIRVLVFFPFNFAILKKSSIFFKTIDQISQIPSSINKNFPFV